MSMEKDSTTINIVVKKQSALLVTEDYRVGEMQPEQLWETSMNPETRILRKVTVEDAVAAAEMIEVCLGQNINDRKSLILNTTFSA